MGSEFSYFYKYRTKLFQDLIKIFNFWSQTSKKAFSKDNNKTFFHLFTWYLCICVWAVLTRPNKVWNTWRQTADDKSRSTKSHTKRLFSSLHCFLFFFSFLYNSLPSLSGWWQKRNKLYKANICCRFVYGMKTYKRTCIAHMQKD